jgi:hypothetical protein
MSFKQPTSNAEVLPIIVGATRLILDLARIVWDCARWVEPVIEALISGDSKTIREILPQVKRKETVWRVHGEEMSQPIMWYMEPHDRITMLLIRVRGRTDRKFTQYRGSPRINTFKGVFMIWLNAPSQVLFAPTNMHKRLKGVANDDALVHILSWVHDTSDKHVDAKGEPVSSVEACPNCQYMNNSYPIDWLAALLRDQDPTFALE